jgi:hypothetical protein
LSFHLFCPVSNAQAIDIQRYFSVIVHGQSIITSEACGPKRKPEALR